MTLVQGETPASAVRLARSVLVETDRGDTDASAGDWLVITSLGRQVVMSDDDYRASTGQGDLASLEEMGALEPVGSPQKPVEKKRIDVFGSLFGRKKPAHLVPVSAPGAVAVFECPENEEVKIPTRPPIPSKPYPPPVADPDSVIIPHRPEGSFLEFMRPGGIDTSVKKKVNPKKKVALPFQKKKKSGKEKKERYRYIRPDWI